MVRARLPQAMLAMASLLCREARAKFQSAMEVLGPTPALLYSEALCCYKMSAPAEALRLVAQVIEKVLPSSYPTA